MNKTRRLSIVTLALVMVLVAIIALPASAVISEDRDSDFTYTSPCNTDKYTAFAQSYLAMNGASAYARTTVSHSPESHNVTVTATVNATFWYYPNGSSTYQTTTRGSQASDQTTTSDNSNAYARATVDDSTIPGTVFSVESSHNVTVVCNSTTNTQVKYLCVGEPAMK